MSLSSDSHVAQNIVACRRPGPGIRQPFDVTARCSAPIRATALPVRFQAAPVALERGPDADVVHTVPFPQQIDGVRQTVREPFGVRIKPDQCFGLAVGARPAVIDHDPGHGNALGAELLHLLDDRGLADVTAERVPRAPAEPGQGFRQRPSVDRGDAAATRAGRDTGADDGVRIGALRHVGDGIGERGAARAVGGDVEPETAANSGWVDDAGNGRATTLPPDGKLPPEVPPSTDFCPSDSGPISPCKSARISSPLNAMTAVHVATGAAHRCPAAVCRPPRRHRRRVGLSRCGKVAAFVAAP